MDQTKVDISFQKQTATDFGVSYFLAIAIPRPLADTIEDRMLAVGRELGDGFYVQPAESLHISVLDYVDSIIDPQKFGYKNKAEVWARIGAQCQAATEAALAGFAPFAIQFNELRVTDGAVILVGQDDGQLEQIRQRIMDGIGDIRLPRTKQPPQIIHTTVARYKEVMPLQPVRELAAAEPLEFALPVTRLHVRNQLKMNMLEYADIQVYDLKQ